MIDAEEESCCLAAAVAETPGPGDRIMGLLKERGRAPGRQLRTGDGTEEYDDAAMYIWCRNGEDDRKCDDEDTEEESALIGLMDKEAEAAGEHAQETHVWNPCRCLCLGFFGQYTCSLFFL